MQQLRLLPLLSSATEIVHALGFGQYQVGRSHECDYPPCVLDLPVCSTPTIDVAGSSGEIDRLVKSRLASALSVYEVNSALVRQLDPTHILTQTQCKVCAVSLEDVEQALRLESAPNARIISLEPFALADLWKDIGRVAAECGDEAAGSRLVTDLRGRMRRIEEHTSGLPRRPSVAAIEWLEPLMAAGNWVPELVEMAGGRNLFGVAGAHSPWMTWEDLVTADPEIIIALPCGFDLARTRAEMRWLTERPEWSALTAVRFGKVFICDGKQFMNRPGPRLVESLQIFAEIFHPDVFEPELYGSGWERF